MHAAEVQLNRSPNSTILAIAAKQDRIVVTADLDFPRLLAALGTTTPGLVLLRGGNYSEAESLECIRRVLMSISPDKLAGSILVVDKKKIRKRPLPI